MANKGLKYGKWTQDDMSRAISAFENGDMGINAVCRTYGVSKPTLKRHLEGRNIHANNEIKKMGRSQELPAELEDEIVQHALKLERMFFGLSRDDLRRLAYQVAEENAIPHRFNRNKKMAGNKWYYAFLKRHPQLALRKPEPTSIARATGFSKERVNEFFELLVKTVDSHKFQAVNIYNVDETALSTVQKPKKVIGLKGKHQIGSMTSAERGVLTTGIFCMSAGGFFLPPMLVFKGQRFKPEWKMGAPPGTEFAMTDNGWSNCDTFLKWLKHFVAYVKPSNENKILLVLDGHASHTKDLNVIKYARANGVVIMSLPSHTSHKLQPLDHSFFAPLKSNFSKAAEKFIRTHQTKITVSHISLLLGESFPKTAIAATAINGFKGCGIWPVDCNKFNDDDYAVGPLPVSIEPPSIQKQSGQTDLLNLPSTSQSPTTVYKPIMEISPIPDVTKSLKRNRKVGPVVEILTSTPYKDALETKKVKKEESEQRKQNKINASKKLDFLTNEKNCPKMKKNIKKTKSNDQWYCKICEEVKEEGMIQCLKCHEWCHEICAGVKPTQKQYLCPSCKNGI